jgi:cytochrome oxidase assembly protein ShyY1
MTPSFEDYISPTHMNNINISHSEYATTWFLVGLLVATTVALAIHIKNTKKTK